MRRRILPALVALCAAVVPAQQPDRSTPPAPGPLRPFAPPVVERRTLANGLRLWVAELHEVPVVHATLVLDAGTSADPPGKYGVAAMTAEMLDEGAGTRDALALADAVDFLGADLDTGSAPDAASIDLHVAAARVAEALPLMADVALRPAFPERELQRIREEVLTSLMQARDDPAALVEIAFPRLVFGSRHRYGTPAVGTAASLKRITVEDLRRFHASRYAPAGATLIVAGDVTLDAIVPRVEKAFGAWTGPAPPRPALPEAPPVSTREVFLVDRPGAEQSQVRVGGVGVPRSTPDYFPLRVLNTILGGAFTSRLNLNLREEHGYAYGAGSAFEMRRGAGTFYAAAGVQTDKTAEALREIFKELDGIRRPIQADELQKARSYLALQLPETFETTAGVAAALSEIAVHDLPPDYFATVTGRVLGVTAADLQRAAERHVRADRMIVVVIGDRKAIESPLRALGIGPVRVIAVDGLMQ